MNKIRVDIGLSHSAPMAFNWLSRDANLIVYGYEPNIYNVEKIKNLDLYQKYKDRFIINNYGLSDREGEFNFYATQEDPGCSSFYEPNDKLGYSYNIIKAKLKKADIIFDNINKNNVIELLKTDTQGNDYNIINCIKNYLDKIVFLDVEISAYQYKLDHDYQLDKLIDFITENNFELIGRSNENGRFYNKKYKNDIDNDLYNNNTVNYFMDY